MKEIIGQFHGISTSNLPPEIIAHILMRRFGLSKHLINTVARCSSIPQEVVQVLEDEYACQEKKAFGNLSEEEKQKKIDEFLKSNKAFDSRTPSFITDNIDCIKASIDRDIDSVLFSNSLSAELELSEYIIRKALEKGYILHKDSPDFLTKEYEVALNSIKLDVDSADFVDWDRIGINDGSNLKTNSLIDAVLKGGYVISEYSNTFLKNNPKIALASIKKNFCSLFFVPERLLKETELFEYVILHGHSFSSTFLLSMPLNKICNKEVLGRCFEQTKVYGCGRKLYRERFDQLFSRALNTYPKIKSYDMIFPVVADKRWENYRTDNINEYINLFGRICSELRNNDNFDDVLNELIFITKMKETLGNQYDDFYQAMKEYFDVYHSDVENKTEKMKHAQDIISSYVTLYLNISKDSFVKQEISDYKDWLKQFFILRLDNPTVNKKLVQSQKKIMFKKLYRDKDVLVCKSLNGIAQNYIQDLNETVIFKLIDGFVLEDNVKVEEIIPKPDKYDDYLKYEKAAKLIKRLNLGNISFEGPEVRSYTDIIGFDEKTGKYVYTGVVFSKEEKAKINDYKKIANIFEKIKKEIYLKIKNMEADVKISSAAIFQLEEELPFTDEYFEFNKSYLEKITLNNLKQALIISYWSSGFETSSFENNDAFKLINDLLVDKGIIWLLLFLEKNDRTLLESSIISRNEMRSIINNAESIAKVAKELGLDSNNFRKLLFLASISSNVDAEALSILGLDVIVKLCNNLGYTGGNKEEILSRAKRLVALMAGRSMSTVPYISGETDNYKYSLYDSQDVDVLLAGINTDACFKVCGNDNDFLHYCCLDKNGIVIKITDKEGNFIARAGGFRNGNCVFLNQLRTIFDGMDCEYESTGNDIIAILRKACEDIVRTSQENDLEKEKIEYIFAVQDFSLEKLEANICEEVNDKIGYYPMETESQDWQDFVEDNSDYLYISKSSDGFTTDYGGPLIICMASIKEPEKLNPEDLRFGDVEALYERTRNKIIATELLDSDLVRKMNKIRGINAYLNGESYEEAKIPEGSTVFVGDNWYCVYAGGTIVDSCVLDFDEKAKREFSLVNAKLKEVTDDYLQQQLKDNQLLEDLQINSEASSYRLNKKLKGSQS